MNDINRYEQTPEKKNIIVVILKMFLTYIRNIFFDFFTSFKYNNMKLPGLLIMIPGALFGFSLKFHSDAVYTMSTFETNIETNYMGIQNISGFLLFILMLFGILNIFAGFSLMGKKNLGSVIACLLSSLVMIVCGVMYLYLLFAYFDGCNKYFDMLEKCMSEMNITAEEARKYLKDESSVYYVVGIPVNERPEISLSEIMSIITVLFFIVSSIAGIILGFIFYDRTYEKVKR